MIDYKMRTKLLACMDYIVSHINNEDIFDAWLLCGVPDGTFDDASLELTVSPEETDLWYSDKNFDNEIMEDMIELFFKLMKHVSKDGGLYY